jgi:hypothetical protein
MPSKKKPMSPEEKERFLGEVWRDRAARQKSYREQALRLLPHVCARCGREFAGKSLRELTVHHKDHNHLNNPTDGSNWELLCLYCHDDEHDRYGKGDHYDGYGQSADREPPLGHQPFQNLKELLNPKADESDTE